MVGRAQTGQGGTKYSRVRSVRKAGSGWTDRQNLNEGMGDTSQDERQERGCAGAQGETVLGRAMGSTCPRKWSSSKG